MDKGWIEENLTGIELIDDRHRAIWSSLGDLIDSINEDYNRDLVIGAFGIFKKNVVDHFADEEELMTDLGYELSEEHKEAHDSFGTLLQATADKLAAGEHPSDEVRTIITEDLPGHVIKHITESDNELTDAVRLKESEGK